MKKIRRQVALLLAGTLSITMTGCGNAHSSRMVAENPANKKPSEVVTIEQTEDSQEDTREDSDLKEQFDGKVSDFSMQLLWQCMQGEAEHTNCMISPASVLIALTMTENGADQETLAQLKEVLGGDLSQEEWNEELSRWVNSLTEKEEKNFKIADSIWIRDTEELKVSDDFLNKNTELFDAEIYRSLFDEKAVEEINQWVNDNTDGMIDQILDKIDEDAMMYLINAVAFDGKWQDPYNNNQVYEETFTDADGNETEVDMMHDEEHRYIELEDATGFIRPYESGYSFVALLPEEGTTVEDFMKEMTGERFQEAVEGAEDCSVETALPKFTSDYETLLNDPLEQLGVQDLFLEEKADLSALGSVKDANLYVSRILHKTHIEVDENGTKAAASTVVEVSKETAMMQEEEPKRVILNRPFVYAIIDDESGLPLFIGVEQSVK